MPLPVHRLLLPPGAWTSLSKADLAQIEGADLLVWEAGSCPGLLAYAASAQRVCELAPGQDAPAELAQSRRPLLIQTPQAPLPSWAREADSQNTVQPNPPQRVGPARVILTRRMSYSRPLGQALAQAGIASLPLPTLALGPPEDPEAFAQTLDHLDPYFGVMITSPQGAACLAQAPKIPDQLKVVAVGAATAKALANQGLPCHLIAQDAHSEGLVQALAQQGWLAKSWLHIRGNKGRSVLGDAVRDAGGGYRLVAGYQVYLPILSSALLVAAFAPQLELVSFASGQSYENFKQLLAQVASPEQVQALLARLQVLSFGPITTQALKRDGVSVQTELARPDPALEEEAMLKCLGSANASKKD